jgi:hypothetical protein
MATKQSRIDPNEEISNKNRLRIRGTNPSSLDAFHYSEGFLLIGTVDPQYCQNPIDHDSAARGAIAPVRSYFAEEEMKRLKVKIFGIFWEGYEHCRREVLSRDKSSISAQR